MNFLSRNRLRVISLPCLALILSFAAHGESTEYTYDALGRLRTVTLENGTVISYTLDATGNRTSVGVSGSGGPFTDVLSMTQGTWTSGPIQLRGYNPGYMGAIAPTLLAGGKTVTGFYDTFNGPQFLESRLWVNGFSSDPGKEWLLSVVINGKTRTGSSAQYSYGSGRAEWRWPSPTFGFLFNTSGTTQCTFQHQ